MWARLADRIRPWRGDVPAATPVVAVVGAGPAGLATAVMLQRHGVRALVIDRRSEVGGTWPTRYDSLRLNTLRWMSDLPGFRMPRRLGRRLERLVGHLDVLDAQGRPAPWCHASGSDSSDSASR